MRLTLRALGTTKDHGPYRTTRGKASVTDPLRRLKKEEKRRKRAIAAGGGGESSVGGGAAAGGGVGGVNASAMIRELFELEYEGPGTQRSGCVLPWSDEGIASNRRFL